MPHCQCYLLTWRLTFLKLQVCTEEHQSSSSTKPGAIHPVNWSRVRKGVVSSPQGKDAFTCLGPEWSGALTGLTQADAQVPAPSRHKELLAPSVTSHQQTCTYPGMKLTAILPKHSRLSFTAFFNHTPQKISSHTCRKTLVVQTGTALPQHCHQFRGVCTTSQPTRSLAPVLCPVPTPLVKLDKHHLPKLALHSPINLLFPLL